MDAASDILHGRPPKIGADFGGSAKGGSQDGQELFRTLRRLHGQNLDHRGLNDLNEAFQSFITRARFFAVGRLRRTWSHSAVEFMKYRRRLPALLAPESDGETDDRLMSIEPFLDDDLCGVMNKVGIIEDMSCRVQVNNVSIRATSTQLASFFSKFGAVASCQVPTFNYAAACESLITYGSLPPRRRRQHTGIAFVTFKNVEDARVAINAAANDLKLYDKVMLLTNAPSRRHRSFKRHTLAESNTSLVSAGSQDSSAPVQYIVEGEADEDCSPFDGFESALLIRVMSYLTIVERIKVERVCKHWMECAYKSWATLPRLSLTKQQLCASGRVRPLQTAWLKAILSRCSPYLQALDLSCTPHLLDDNAINVIANHSTNLRHLNLSGVYITSTNLRLLGDSLQSLQSLVYCNAENCNEKTFWNLLRACSNLVSLNLSGGRQLTGKCFRLLGVSLVEIRLSDCPSLTAQAIEEMCINSPNVCVLMLDNCAKLTDECLGILSRTYADSLTTLSLKTNRSMKHDDPTSMNFSSAALLDIAKMTQIRHLLLDGQPNVNDMMIEAVIDGLPNLDTLSIGGCGTSQTITGASLKAISMAPHLSLLNLSHLACVTDATLQLLGAHPRLLNLCLRECQQLVGGSLNILIDGCPAMEKVDLGGCLKLNTEAVINSINNCDGKSKCHITLGGGGCDIGLLRASITTSNITIDSSDHSIYNVMCMSSRNDEPIVENSDDEMTSDDEFESLTAQRSFIIDLDEDEYMPPDGETCKPSQFTEEYKKVLLESQLMSAPSPAVARKK